jgi:hypothetical protein
VSRVDEDGSNIMGDGVGNKRKFPCRRRRGSSLEGSESSSNTNASRGVVVVEVLGVRRSEVSSRLLLYSSVTC